MEISKFLGENYLFRLVLLLIAGFSKSELITNNLDFSEPYANEVQHLVSVRLQNRDDFQFSVGHICGGSLVSINVVITAAHCLVDQTKYDGSLLNIKSDFLVYLGEKNFDNNHNFLLYAIQELVMQSNKFDFNTYKNDVALLVLRETVPQHEANILPIQLATYISPPLMRCQIFSWGSTNVNCKMQPVRTIPVELIKDRSCRRIFNLTKLLSKELHCAVYLGEELTTGCYTDSGGPLVCNGQLAGIVTWGVRCEQPYLPLVYTDILPYRTWILETIANNQNLKLWHIRSLRELEAKSTAPPSISKAYILKNFNSFTAFAIHITIAYFLAIL